MVAIPMERRRIGSLEVSVVGLGCNNFGRRLDEAGTRAVVDAALESGVNLLDTADIYGGTKSEEFLGSVLQGRRDRVVLATKFGMPVDDDHKGAHPAYVKRACEASLRRLRTDRIDLYQLHTPDPTVPIADTLGALDELVREGKVREIGCSNFNAAQIEAAHMFATGARFASVQNEYSILHREPEAEVLPACERLGLALLPYFPLASGLLTGKYRRGAPLPEGARITANPGRWITEARLETVEALIAWAEGRGHTLHELAFAWLLATPVVASVIAGATSAAQIRANAGVTWRLTPAEAEQVRAIAAAR
jgi:aryl-alcohol dehydrogenase-like predicted oxidoreductase